MPLSVYMKSAWRHFWTWWWLHRMMIAGNYPNPLLLEDALCGVIFNASGYLHEQLVEGREKEIEVEKPTQEEARERLLREAPELEDWQIEDPAAIDVLNNPGL